MTAADWLAPIITIISAGLGAWVASVVAINRWRTEMTGRRRAELAEEVLTDFYRFRTEIHSFVWQARFAGDPKHLDQIWRRLTRFVSELESRHHRFAAVFGTEAAKPYEELLKVKNQIAMKADLLPDEGPFGDDPIDPEIYASMDAAIAQMEVTCRAAITAEETPRRWPWQR